MQNEVRRYEIFAGQRRLLLSRYKNGLIVVTLSPNDSIFSSEALIPKNGASTTEGLYFEPDANLFANFQPVCGTKAKLKLQSDTVIGHLIFRPRKAAVAGVAAANGDSAAAATNAAGPSNPLQAGPDKVVPHVNVGPATDVNQNVSEIVNIDEQEVPPMGVPVPAGVLGFVCEVVQDRNVDFSIREKLAADTYFVILSPPNNLKKETNLESLAAPYELVRLTSGFNADSP